MKIAFIVGVFPLLSETFILNQITGLLDLGHDVRVFASKRNFGEMHADVKKYHLLSRVYFFNIPENKIKRVLKALYLILLNFYKNPLAILKSLNIVKFKKKALSLELLYKVIPFLNKDFDVIHCHFGINGLTGVAINEIAIKTKIITAFHGYDLSKYLKFGGYKSYKHLFDKCDLFLPVSDNWKRILISLGCDCNKIKVHRMGVDIERFKPSKKIKKNKKIQLLSICRFVEKKGIEYGILAFFEVVKKHPDIQYNIIGEGDLKEKIRKLISETGCEEKINLLGAKTQDVVAKIMQESDILIAPSVVGFDGDSEGIPVVIMEAMATGLPVVSTLHSAIPELVIDKVTGFLVPEKNVGLMADKISYLIENPALRTSMGIKGREKILREYNIKILNEELAGIFGSI